MRMLLRTRFTCGEFFCEKLAKGFIVRIPMYEERLFQRSLRNIVF